MASVLKLLKHDVFDDHNGHQYDVFWVEQGIIGGGNHNELPLDTTVEYPLMSSVAVLHDGGTQTQSTATLFYGGGANGGYKIRLTGGVAGERVAIIARRESTGGGGSHQISPRFD